MNLKKFKSEVYKSIHFLKVCSVRILKSSVLQQIYRVGQLLYRVKQTKSYVNNGLLFPPLQYTSNKFMVNGCAFNVALPITHPCIPK